MASESSKQRRKEEVLCLPLFFLRSCFDCRVFFLVCLLSAFDGVVALPKPQSSSYF